jgi:energy-coupling factor transporter ATP-binding protein EcfA2
MTNPPDDPSRGVCAPAHSSRDPALDTLRPLLERAQDLTKALRRIRGRHYEPAATLAATLESATQAARQRDPRRPLCLALLGGTGTGKSTLFNALVGLPEASPTSATIRAFTRQAHIAAEARDRVWCEDLDLSAPVFAEGGVPGLILVDTPDIDSVEAQHLDTARTVLEWADIVLYVTSPDKRANEDVLREMRAWSGRKRWFFALNKADTLPAADREEAWRDFGRRLEETGFAPTGAEMFLLGLTHRAGSRAEPVTEENSACAPDDFDLDRLRGALYGTRSAEQRRRLNEESALRTMQAALEDPDGRPALRRQTAAAEQALSELNGRAHRAWLEHLHAPPCRFLLNRLWTRRLWSVAAHRVEGPLGCWTHLRARLATVALARQSNRARASGRWGGAWREARALVADATAPVWNLMAPDHATRRRLADIENDARRTAEDLSLDPVTGQDPVSAPGAATALETLDLALERQSAVAVESSIRRWHLFFGALLPITVLGFDLFRLARAWLAGDWLPGSFYATAGGMLLASLLPGHWLIAAALRRSAGRLPVIVEDALLAWDSVPQTAPLREPLNERVALLQQADRLARDIEAQRGAAGRDLPGARFGAVRCAAP